MCVCVCVFGGPIPVFDGNSLLCILLSFHKSLNLHKRGTSLGFLQM